LAGSGAEPPPAQNSGFATNGNMCTEMKEMINNLESASSLSTNNQPSITVSDNILQQTSSPNLVPNVPLSVTIPSNLHVSTSGSISVSTGDDDHESIRKESSSSSSVTKTEIKRKVNAINSSYSTKELAKRTRKQ